VFAVFSFLFIAFAVYMPDTLARLEDSFLSVFGIAPRGTTTDRHVNLEYDGIDVSHHQGEIDWHKVAADSCVQFVYIKATEGSTHVDSLYEENMSGARHAGLKVGSYHYLTSSSSILRQFVNFEQNVSVDKQNLIPVIDVEEEGVKGWSAEQLQDSLAILAYMMKDTYGKLPVLYCYSQFYMQNLSPRFDNFHLFIADYGNGSRLAKGVGRHNIWQHSAQGVVDGIYTNVDLDMFEPGSTLTDFLLK
jgi:lysozyme